MQAITGQLHEVTSASISNKTVLKATFDSAINNWQHLLLSAKGNLMQLEQYLATSRELRQYQRQIKDRLKLCRLSRIDFEVLHYLHQGFTQPGLIANGAILNKSQITRSMRCLEELNLMEYDFVDHDRRARIIQITSNGKRLYRQLVESMKNMAM